MIKQIEYYESEYWDEIIKSFPDYEVFYLNAYVVAFMNESPKNGIPILLLYEHGGDRAVNVVFKRDIALDDNFQSGLEKEKYFDLISPYGYGGFKGYVSDYKILNEEYNKYCAFNGLVCEFVRFDLFSDYHEHYDGTVETRTHNVIRDLQIPLEEMWMDFKQKVRKNVKRAVQSNLQIVVENTDAHLQDFLDIYYSTMERNDADKAYYFSRDFFEKINSMSDNIMYFHVMHEGKVISTELVIYGAENCYSYLGGTKTDYYDLRPNEFLKYEVIKWAKEKGLKNFVFGGGYGSDDGIFQYKACFAPNGIVNFYIGRKIFDESTYNKLVQYREIEAPECVHSDFFPAYRA